MPPPASAGEAYSEDTGDRHDIGVIFTADIGLTDDEHHGVPDQFTGYVFAETRGVSSPWQTLEVLRLSRMEVGPTTAGGNADFIVERFTLRRDWRTDANFAATARSPAGGV